MRRAPPRESWASPCNRDDPPVEQCWRHGFLSYCLSGVAMSTSRTIVQDHLTIETKKAPRPVGPGLMRRRTLRPHGFPRKQQQAQGAIVCEVFHMHLTYTLSSAIVKQIPGIAAQNLEGRLPSRKFAQGNAREQMAPWVVTVRGVNQRAPLRAITCVPGGAFRSPNATRSTAQTVRPSSACPGA